MIDTADDGGYGKGVPWKRNRCLFIAFSRFDVDLGIDERIDLASHSNPAIFQYHSIICLSSTAVNHVQPIRIRNTFSTYT